MAARLLERDSDSPQWLVDALNGTAATSSCQISRYPLYQDDRLPPWSLAQDPALTRRRLLQLAALGTAAGMAPSLLWPTRSEASLGALILRYSVIEGAETAIKWISRALIENPLAAAVVAVVGTAIVYAANEYLKELERQRSQQQQALAAQLTRSGGGYLDTRASDTIPPGVAAVWRCGSSENIVTVQVRNETSQPYLSDRIDAALVDAATGRVESTGELTGRIFLLRDKPPAEFSVPYRGAVPYPGLKQLVPRAERATCFPFGLLLVRA